MEISLGWILYIAPALEQFNSDHRITEEYLLELCEASQTVPEGQRPIGQRGFSSGFKVIFPQPFIFWFPN
jgi:hypothetical protein